MGLLIDTKSETSSSINIPIHTERISEAMSNIEEVKPLLTKNETLEASSIPLNSTIELNDTEVEPISLEEPSIGKGIAGALEIFRKRGLIGKEKFIGRYKDSTPKFDKTGEVNIEYRDEKGRQQTPKEAYRYLCHIFHQNKPSKRKQEKKLIKEEQEEKNRNKDVSDTKTLRYLKSQQMKTSVPYVVLQGKNINNL